MSSDCPWGRTPGQPGEYVGEYKGMNWLLCPWAGENSRHCLSSKERGGGIRNFVKFTDTNHWDIRGICRFPQPINTGNIKGAKRIIRVFELMLSMISYLNLSSGVYIPLYWFFVIKIFNIYCFFKPNWWMLKIWSPNHHWTVPSMKWISLYHLYAAYMRWISGGSFVKKHLTQGTLSC